MKQLLISGIASLLLLPNVSLAADSVKVLSGLGQTQTYTNNGTISTPQIDAVNVVNYGTFFASAVQPFETFSTLNYTNSGIMEAITGFRFNYSSPTTPERRPAANFVNLNPGFVAALDTSFPSIPPVPCAVAPVEPSYLWIIATNIISGAGSPEGGASLNVGANGEMRLVGKNVDLSRSGLQVFPIWNTIFEPHSTATIGNPVTMFQADTAMYDRYWAQASFSQQNSLASGGLWNGTTASAPSEQATPAASTALSFVPSLADSYINVLPRGTLTVTLTNYDLTDPTNPIEVRTQVTLATNIAKGAYFLAAPPEFALQAGFSGGGNFSAVDAFMTVDMPNVVTGLSEPADIWFEDTFATGTRGIIANVIGCPTNSFKPANYTMARFLQTSGSPGNHGIPERDFFISSSAITTDTNVYFDGYTNAADQTIIVGDYSVYSSFFDNIVSRPPDVPGGYSSTNFPGRIRIFADNLDLTETRIRGEGEVLIQTTNLISTTNTIVDCENLRFNLNSRSGSVKVENMAKLTANRLRGNVDTFSATWNGTVTVRFTNNFGLGVGDVTTNDTGGSITNFVLVSSNLEYTVNIGFAVTMIDARAVQTVVPVYVYDLISQGKDTVVNDDMTLIEKLQINGESFTLNGSLIIPGSYPANPIPATPVTSVGTPLYNWTAANAPNVRFFTNNGTLSIPNLAHLGDDRPRYARFINTGNISANGVSLSSEYFENGGSISAFNGLFVQVGTAKLENGSTTSGTVSSFSGSDYKLSHYDITAVGKLLLAVTNSLADAGPGSDNLVRVGDGINLQTKARTGDLLGTTLQSAAPSVPSVRITHVWAGEDRGASPAGFSDNAALGRLQLTSASPNPVFAFSGAGTRNGLYADLLDLSLFTSESDLLRGLQISGNMVIYFAAANLGFTPPNNTNGIPQEPEEYLDGLFGGHLRWVRTFAGPNSSQMAVINGQTVAVNRALFNSKIIDSDNDSVPNFYDAGLNGDIFQTAPVSIQVIGNGSVVGNVDNLIVGETYSVVAVPGSGAAFTGWSGSIETNTPALTFVMQPGLEFVAHFTFQPGVGTYNGLFASADGVVFLQSGSFSAKVTKGGKYSAKIQVGKSKFSVSGQLDEGGADARPVPKSGMFLEIQAAPDRITGTISQGDEWSADLIADRAVFDGKTKVAPFAGTYTMVIPGSTIAGVPAGDSYGTITVDTSGNVKFSGSLADGTKVSQSSVASATGQWPLYQSLYGGLGQLFAPITAGGPSGDVTGPVSWIKQPTAKARFYPDGFQYDTNVIGSVYNPSLHPVTRFTDGSVVLSGGNLATGINNRLLVTPANVATAVGTNKLTISLSASQGLFKGTAVDPSTGKKIQFNGVLLQNSQSGSGVLPWYRSERRSLDRVLA